MPRPDGSCASPFDVKLSIPQATISSTPQSSPFDAPPGAWVPAVAVERPPGSWIPGGVASLPQPAPGSWIPGGAAPLPLPAPGSWIPGGAAPLPQPTLDLHSDRTRYFVITSNTKENVVKAVRHSMWATQKKNESNLDNAYRYSPAAILVFSVNGSDAFQGYARMRSPVGKPYSRAIDPFNNFGRLFDIEWLRLHDLPYHEVEHIRNPLNGDKSVRWSRDGQELSNTCGRALCGLIDRHVDEPQSFQRERPRSRSRGRYSLMQSQPVASTLPGDFVPRSRSRSSESAGRKNQKRTPHPLNATFEEQVEFFLGMDYEDYMRWWSTHSAKNPGPTAPPGLPHHVQTGSTPPPAFMPAQLAIQVAGVFQ